jgi:hypothetical protein
VFGSTALEVAIGVIFVYLSLSLVCTAANELIASLTTWRARNLADGIRNLLNYKSNDELLKGLYNHSLIQSLYRDEKKLPSYIPSRTFALALMDIIVPSGSSDRDSLDGIRQAVRKAVEGNVIDKQVRDTLLVFIDEADRSFKEAVTDLQKAETAMSRVQENVERWFNDSMERVAGWYKRKTQALTFALALTFTVALNVDSIMITKRLSADTTLRSAVVATAEKSAQQPVAVVVTPPSSLGAMPAGQEIAEDRTSAAFQALLKNQTALQSLGLPLGWGDRKNWPEGTGWPVFWDWVAKAFGLLLTAGAASLGAPFWFDMLNKIVSIRSSGKAPEEKQKSPKEVPTPTEAGQTPREARESRDVLSEFKGTLSELKESLESLKSKPQ